MAGATQTERNVDALGIFAHGLFVVIGGLLVFAFAWALVPAVQQQNDAPCRALAPEARDLEMPAATLQDLSGKQMQLSDFAGKFVVVNFWASWCEPCITEWPELDQLAQRFADRDDVEVLAISVEEDFDAMRSFVKGMSLEGTPVRVLWDPKQRVHTSFGSSKLPDTYFIDRSGRVTHAFINVREWGTPGAAACVESAAAR